MSLIELLITISILIILAAIAIPQYMKYKVLAHDAETQVTLRHLLIVCKVYWDDTRSENICDPSVASSGAYGFVIPDDLEISGSGTEPSFTATASHVSSPNTFTVDHRGAIQ